MTNRGQAHTLEGIVGGLLLLSGLVFALQATAVTPLSASTSSQHIENQLEASAEGVLAAAANDSGDPRSQSALKNATLHWNESDQHSRFHGLAEGEEHFTAGGPPNEFGALLNRTFGNGEIDGRGIAFNVYLIPLTRAESSTVAPATPKRLVYRGAPSDNAATASRVVTIHERDRLLDDNRNLRGTLSSSSAFYASDVAPHSTVFNAVRVEVVVWRM